jgi:hypothetical protein
VLKLASSAAISGRLEEEARLRHNERMGTAAVRRSSQMDRGESVRTFSGDMNDEDGIMLNPMRKETRRSVGQEQGQRQAEGHGHDQGEGLTRRKSAFVEL